MKNLDQAEALLMVASARRCGVTASCVRKTMGDKVGQKLWALAIIAEAFPALNMSGLDGKKIASIDGDVAVELARDVRGERDYLPRDQWVMSAGLVGNRLGI